MKGDDDDDEDSGAIGVSRYPCMPSLVALQQMRNRLQLAHLGRKLMKWTALATGKEMRRLAMELDQASKSFHDDCKNAFMVLARGRYCFPSMNTFVLESVPRRPHTAHVKVTTTVRTVTAVKCIIYTLVKLNADPYEILMVSRGGEQCLEARTVWFELLVEMINLLQLRTCYLVAEAAHQSANKKSKVLGKVVIPRINDTIAYIQSEMEERAREEFFRMKKIIQVKDKKRKKAEPKKEPKPEPKPEPEPVPVVPSPLPTPTPEISEVVPPTPVPEKRVCPHTCVRPERSLVVSDAPSKEQEEALRLTQEEPVNVPDRDRDALPSAEIDSEPVSMPKTPPLVTPKASKRSRPQYSAVSSRPSVRITVPKEEEKVQKISTYQKETFTRSESRTTTRSFPEVPSQPFPRTIQGPVCKVCNSCRPRPQCKHKVFEGNVCKECQLCCKTSGIIGADEQDEQLSEVIILGDGYDEGQFETEETVREVVETEIITSIGEASQKFQYEDAVSINTIGTIGDLSLDDEIAGEQTNSLSFTSDPIYKIESSQTTTVRKITKKDGTVIQQKEVTKITMETVPEDIERRKSREITEQIAELQKFLCKTCIRTEEPDRRIRIENPDKRQSDKRPSRETEPEVQFENICTCANCPEPDREETFCLCKKKSVPEPSDPAKCSYEWSCGGAVPECSVRKKKKEDGDVNSHEQP